MDLPKINNVVLPMFDSWKEDYEKVATTATTEDGKDEQVTVRQKKLVVTATFKVTSNYAKMFAKWSQEDTLTLVCYDLASDTYLSHIVHMEDFSSDLKKHSQDIDNNVSKGIWTVSFKLEEF